MVCSQWPNAYWIFLSRAAPPALSFQTLVQQLCGFSVHSRIIVVAYLKKIHALLHFEIGSLSVPENPFTAYRTAAGQSDML